jgi:hypothetical protein
LICAKISDPTNAWPTERGRVVFSSPGCRRRVLGRERVHLAAQRFVAVDLLDLRVEGLRFVQVRVDLRALLGGDLAVFLLRGAQEGPGLRDGFLLLGLELGALACVLHVRVSSDLSCADNSSRQGARGRDSWVVSAAGGGSWTVVVSGSEGD